MPEVCEDYRRESRAPERIFVLLTRDEKRAASVTLRQGIEGVRSLECVPEGWLPGVLYVEKSRDGVGLLLRIDQRGVAPCRRKRLDTRANGNRICRAR